MSKVREIIETEVGSQGQCIIFVNRKDETKTLEQGLQDLSCKALSGDVPQQDRERIYRDFKQKNLRVLIATNVAARGLDISGIDLVIQYSPPQDVASYIHRAGRTGRKSLPGKCITLFDRREEQAIHKIESHINNRLQHYQCNSTSSSNQYIQKRPYRSDDYQKPQAQRDQGSFRNSQIFELFVTGFSHDVDERDFRSFLEDQGVSC